MAEDYKMERDGFRVQKITRESDKIKLLKFRHKIFREQLGWLVESEDGLDTDEYDAFSDSYGVLNRKGEVVGSIRLTPGDFPFMVEREFCAALTQSLCDSQRKGYSRDYSFRCSRDAGW